MMRADSFNSEIYFENSTYMNYNEQHPSFTNNNCIYEDEPEIDVPQNLSSKQYRFRFPPKATIDKLSYLDDEELEYSFFDLTSFPDVSLCTADESVISADHMVSEIFQQQCLMTEDAELMDDSRLSPLQLPEQICITNASGAHESSYQSNPAVVGPSNFLFNVTRKTTQQGSSSSRSEHETNTSSSPTISSHTISSKTVYFRILKSSDPLQPYKIIDECFSNVDEGFEDGDNTEVELDSEQKFYPLSEQEQLEFARDEAAIKIQSIWRGFSSRKNTSQFKFLTQFASIYTRTHQHQMMTVNERLNKLEQQLIEERTMRMTLEKKMDTLLIAVEDEQNHMFDTIDHLESRLNEETVARRTLEESTSELQKILLESEQCRALQLKKDKQDKEEMQKQIDMLKKMVSGRSKVTPSSPKLNTSKEITPARVNSATANAMKSNDSARTTRRKMTGTPLQVKAETKIGRNLPPRPSNVPSVRPSNLPSTRPSNVPSMRSPEPKITGRINRIGSSFRD